MAFATTLPESLFRGSNWFAHIPRCTVSQWRAKVEAMEASTMSLYGSGTNKCRIGRQLWAGRWGHKSWPQQFTSLLCTPLLPYSRAHSINGVVKGRIGSWCPPHHPQPSHPLPHPSGRNVLCFWRWYHFSCC